MKNANFLVVVFCLMIFAMAGAASAAPSVIKTNGTTILVNGKPTFPVSMIGICMSDATYEPCATSLSRNPNIDYDLFTVKWRGSFISSGIQDQYKNSGVFVSWMYAWASGTSAWDKSNQWFDNLQDPALGVGGVAIKDQPNFFGYSLDEPDNANNVLSRDQLVIMYNYMRSKDPNHPVMINLCCDPNPVKNGIYGLSDYKSAADILSWDTYPYSNYFVRRGSWSLPDSLYGWEHVANHPVFHTLKDLDSFGKPVSTIIQANGLVEGDTQVMPDNMIRANVYLAIALGVDGIEFWQYNAKPIPGSYTGLVTNQTKNAYVQQIAAELKSFEPFLLLPRIAYSWQYQQDYTSVSFSNNPSKTILSVPRKALNYRLIKDASSTYYLIVVNKDANPISTDITIQALAGTGAMTAKTLGLETAGSAKAGRIITVNNGKFTDTFDGYGAHIYQICSGTCSSQNQNPPPTCTDGIKNQAETGVDCGGPCLACATNPAPTSLTLKPGWNQISSPLAAGIDVSAIEAAGCVILPYKNQKLWAWNAQTQAWINPTKVEPFKGYWIYAAYQCTVPLSGTAATFTSLPLTVGWNKISASGTFSAIQGTCANHITGNWIWNWDKATEKWIHPATMQLDKGYWIKVDQNCVLGG